MIRYNRRAVRVDGQQHTRLLEALTHRSERIRLVALGLAVRCIHAPTRIHIVASSKTQLRGSPQHEHLETVGAIAQQHHR